MKRERDIFLTALMFFSRIPVPRWLNYHYEAEYMQAGSRYFPLIGSLVGAMAGLSYWLSALLLPVPVAILISMASSVLLTGAFHEDGWADFCDGFGGGTNSAQVLAIMKDSRLGSYGALGLFFMLLLKAVSLYELQQVGNLWLMLIAAHSLSRLVAASVIFSHDYVRDDAHAKAKPLASSMSLASLFLASFFGLLPLLALPVICWIALPATFLTRFIMLRVMLKRIGGYTGDCLGAIQQMSELIIYLIWLCIISA